jgi:uncharacterized protein with PIN domain
MICPQCRSADCRRSRRAGAADFLGTVIGLKPWRCQTCEFRFHASRVAVSFSGYAHCPRCGNFDLEHIARDRVQDGVLLFLQRFLGFPAYRCDPCRQKFFSLRPFRRILPSMVPAAERKVVNS